MKTQGGEAVACVVFCTAFAFNSPCVGGQRRLTLSASLRRHNKVPQGAAMASSVWKGYLSFGLLSIPIRLFTAARGDRIGLNQLHEVCHSRIKMPLFCPTCDRKVERSEIVKGYEYEKDQYVLFSDEDLDKIEPESARAMEILEFVKVDEIDPLYYDASYYLTPEEEGKKAYSLLLKAMEDSGYAAIAKVTMHQREHIVVIRARAEGMTLHTMFYQSEIREVAEFSHQDKVEPKEQEKKLAVQLIDSLAATFEPAKYRDEYQESMRAMISAKQKGQEVTATVHPQRAPVIDLMDALRKSINAKPAASGKKPPVRVINAAPAAKKASKKATG
jgi:DNA end-binding protein Ku